MQTYIKNMNKCMFVVNPCFSFASDMNLTPICYQHLTNQNKAGEMEKSVILLVTAGHGVHLFNILNKSPRCNPVLSDANGPLDHCC